MTYIPTSLRCLSNPITKERAYDIFTKLRNRGVEELVAVRITNSFLAKEELDTTRMSKDILANVERVPSMIKDLTTQVLQPEPPKPKAPKIIQPSLGLGGIWD